MRTKLGRRDGVRRILTSLTLLGLVVALHGGVDGGGGVFAKPRLPAGAIAGIDLQRIGTIRDYPAAAGCLVVNVDADGLMTVESRAVNLKTLAPHLRKRADASREKGPAGASDLDVMLRLDRRLPWGVAQWLMQACASPDIRIRRIHFAVLPEGDGEEGSLPAFLPTDPGLTRTGRLVQEKVTISAKVSMRSGPGSDPAALYAKLREFIREDPTLPGEIDAHRMVPVGFVLRVVDAYARAGIDDVTFVGTPPPYGSSAIVTLAAKAKSRSGAPTITLLGQTVSAKARIAMPAVARRGPVSAGWPEGGGRLVKEVPPLEDFPPEEIEPPVVGDPPIEGPPSNPAIGVGGGAGGAFRGRGGRRNLRAEGGGGTQGAVDLGLEWLKNHQDPEGYWDCDGFEAQCKLNKCGGPGHAHFDPGITGLALMAFLGAGETHKTGRYRHSVKSGLAYLKQVQDAEGCFGPRATNRFTYNHGCAALAMIEAYALTGSPLFKQSAQFGIDFIERCRNPYLAWRYGVRPQDNDTSVTGWMIAALRSAKDAGGLRVPKDAFEGAKNWLDKVTEPEYGKVGYTARGTGPCRLKDIIDRFPSDRSESLTAVGILTRIFLGEDPKSSEMIQKGVALCQKRLPDWDEASGSIDMYYWYFGSQAMFQVGGAPWKAWNMAMKISFVDHQRKDGDQRGSWNPVGPWGREGGRIYSTAMGVLCLEVYYRYSRVFSSRRR